MMHLRTSRLFTVLVVLLPLLLHAGSESPRVEWDRTFGGNRSDLANSIRQTSDGGYIVAGSTQSIGAGGFDFYLIKIAADGNEVWSRTFGGVGFDVAHSVQQTADGGYIIAGGTTSFGAGESDVYLVKTDNEGNEIWSQTFGGEDRDEGLSVQRTSDGAFIIAGTTNSFGAGEDDVYLIKTDTAGNALWSRTFGGQWWDRGYSVLEIRSGGYVVVGSTDVPGVDRLRTDVYLIRVDREGNEEWSTTFEARDVAEGYAVGYSVQETSDGGFIIVGTDGENVGCKGRKACGTADVYVIRTDPSGGRMWSQRYGHEGVDDAGYAVQETADGGYVIAGDAVIFWHWMEALILKIDNVGNEEWSQTFHEEAGLDSWYSFQSLDQTGTGGHIIVGWRSWPSDVYLLKLSPPVPFIRGHTNTDAELDISDAVCLLSYLFGAEGDPCKQRVPRCLDAADANDDGMIDIADAVSILSHLFASAGPLPEPFTTCGYDETHDGVRCFEFEACR